MKKFIPIFSITIASVLMQNCTHRDEEINLSDDQFGKIENTMMLKGDSARSSEEIVDPDPPVRDGDNWRIVPNK